MPSPPLDLDRDALFQLNMVLWLAAPMPPGLDITPIFHDHGFRVYALSPPLSPPPDVRLAALDAGVHMQDRVAPDVVLAHEGQGRFAFVECKGSSFGAASSTAEQARALLCVAGERAADVLGLDPAHVSAALLAYLLPDSDRGMMAETLVALSEQLGERGLPCARSTVLGILFADGQVGATVDAAGSAFFGLPEGPNFFLRRHPETDPRPLYFIPYDPGLDQSTDERVRGKRVLFERMHCSVLSAVGRANPPVELLFDTRRLLNDAMFGLFAAWEDRSSARHLRGLCRQLMGSLTQALNLAAPNVVAFEPGAGWRFRLDDAQAHERVMDALTGFFCGESEVRAQPEAELFDDLDDEAHSPDRP